MKRQAVWLSELASFRDDYFNTTVLLPARWAVIAGDRDELTFAGRGKPVGCDGNPPIFNRAQK
jgi:hypothetical protein